MRAKAGAPAAAAGCSDAPMKQTLDQGPSCCVSASGASSGGLFLWRADSQGHDQVRPPVGRDHGTLNFAYGRGSPGSSRGPRGGRSQHPAHAPCRPSGTATMTATCRASMKRRCSATRTPVAVLRLAPASRPSPCSLPPAPAAAPARRRPITAGRRRLREICAPWSRELRRTPLQRAPRPHPRLAGWRAFKTDCPRCRRRRLPAPSPGSRWRASASCCRAPTTSPRAPASGRATST